MIYSKSSVLKNLGSWEYDEIKIEDPNSNQALVKIHSCGICSTDVVRSMKVGFYSYPIVPGHEMVGTVYKLGKKCKDIKEGDNVCVYPLITKCSPTNDLSCTCSDLDQTPNLCSDYDFLGSRSHGGYSEFVLSPVENLVKINDKISKDIAVFTEPAAVALHAFEVAKKHNKFEKVLILGLGPIGVLVANWCKINQIPFVVGLDRNAHRFKNFMDSGYSDIIDTSKSTLEDKVKSLSPKGFDVVFECTGTEEMLNNGINSLRPKGHLVILSNQIKKASLDHKTLNNIIRKEINITGSWSSLIHPNNEWSASMIGLGDFQSKITGLLSHKYKFSDCDKVFKDMYNKDFKFSKVVLYPE